MMQVGPCAALFCMTDIAPALVHLWFIAMHRAELKVFTFL